MTDDLPHAVGLGQLGRPTTGNRRLFWNSHISPITSRKVLPLVEATIVLFGGAVVSVEIDAAAADNLAFVFEPTLKNYIRSRKLIRVPGGKILSLL